MTGFKAGLLIVLLALCSMMYIKNSQAEEANKDLALCSTVAELAAVVQDDRQKFNMSLHDYLKAIKAEVGEGDWRLSWIMAIAVTVYNKSSFEDHPLDVGGREFKRCMTKRGHELES